MTTSGIRLAELPATDGLRSALRVKRAAQIMDADASGIIKLIKAGELEGYRHGADWRVFADSLADYQRRRAHQPTMRPTKKTADNRQSSTAAHRESLTFLQTLGCRVTSRP